MSSLLGLELLCSTHSLVPLTLQCTLDAVAVNCFSFVACSGKTIEDALSTFCLFFLSHSLYFNGLSARGLPAFSCLFYLTTSFMLFLHHLLHSAVMMFEQCLAKKTHTIREQIAILENAVCLTYQVFKSSDKNGRKWLECKIYKLVNLDGDEYMCVSTAHLFNRNLINILSLYSYASVCIFPFYYCSACTMQANKSSYNFFSWLCVVQVYMCLILSSLSKQISCRIPAPSNLGALQHTCIINCYVTPDRLPEHMFTYEHIEN